MRTFDTLRGYAIGTLVVGAWLNSVAMMFASAATILVATIFLEAVDW